MSMRGLLVLGLVMSSTSSVAFTEEKYNPLADPAAVVISGNARFTILTPGVVRMEWSPDGRFEDRASYAFVNRRLPVPKFEQETKDGWLTIDTAAMSIRYKVGARFDRDGLAVTIKNRPKAGTEVRPPFKDDANLGGTTRTLDGVSGSCPLEPGLLSRNGWTCVDDSQRILFDKTAAGPKPQVPGPSSWPWAAPRRHPATGNNPQSAIQNPNSLDWYFFVYGHDYKGALADFIKIAGRIPLPPRFVFGAWWSRYWDYTDAELRQLVAEFKEHNVPLDVLVIDMGWHLDGWTGYTWNPKYFPDPEGFLKRAHQQGLKVTLNLHPAEGVGKQEKAFPEFCRAMGLDPAKVDRIPFDCTDRRYVDAYFRLLHHPLEKMGVDFWWMDYQQDRQTKIPGLDPLPWLNYLHWTDMERRNSTTEGTEDTERKTNGQDLQDSQDSTKSHVHPVSPVHSTPSSVPSVTSVVSSSSRRPLIFSRWGGLGNHRYQIGFSGDTFCNWQSLAFQPYFTATAGNVGYAYWSHDIGGHQPGPVDPELYVRWIQWGALSPILRTHTTKNPDAERRIWKFPKEYYEAAKKAYELRYELIPYIYSSARQCYDTGLPLCRPLYYEWPEIEEAYTWKNEYMFGDQLLVAPVTEPAEPISGCAMVEVWIPPGEWTNWFTGRTYTGPKVVPLVVPLDEIPLFAKRGAEFLSLRKAHRRPGTVLEGETIRDRVRHLGLHYKLSLAPALERPDRLEARCRLVCAGDSPESAKLDGRVRILGENLSSSTDAEQKGFHRLRPDEPILVTARRGTIGDRQSDYVRAEIEVRGADESFVIPLEVLVLPSINAWHILGPFDAPIDKALDMPFPPDKKVDLKAQFDGKGGQKIGWKEYQRPIKPGDDLTSEFFVDFDDVFGRRVYDCVVYGFTYLDAPEDMDAVLRFGTDDGYVLFLNGKEIQRKAIGRPYSSKSDEARVRLKKGRNELLLKVSQGGGDGGFCVHVEDEKGKPLTAVKARLQ